MPISCSTEPSLRYRCRAVVVVPHRERQTECRSITRHNRAAGYGDVCEKGGVSPHSEQRRHAAFHGVISYERDTSLLFLYCIQQILFFMMYICLRKKSLYAAIDTT